MGTICVVACGNSKRAESAPAYELYTGPFFTGCMRVARSVYPLEMIYILSAKYGLIKSTTTLKPYNEFLSDPPSPEYIDMIRSQAHNMGLVDQKVVALGGALYCSVLRQVFPEVKVPFQGRNMMQIMRRMYDFLESRQTVRD